MIHYDHFIDKDIHESLQSIIEWKCFIIFNILSHQIRIRNLKLFGLRYGIETFQVRLIIVTK